VLLEVPARLHITLADLGNATSRRYGGAGFSILQPSVVVNVKSSSSVSVHGQSLLDHRARREVADAVTRFLGRYPHATADLTLLAVPPQHVGLGTKTSVVLGVLAGLASGAGLNVSQAELQRLSGRGGTSGVGIHTFFEGGFVVDAGHRPAVGPFGPSSTGPPAEVPLKICHFAVPAAWRFHLMLPNGLRRSGRAEIGFFARNTAIASDEVREVLALMYHGLAPAVLTDDLDLLATTLIAIHRVGFKRRELEGQSPDVRDLLARLHAMPNCPAGMSSMGPLVYVVTRAGSAVSRRVRRLARELDVKFIGTFPASDSGYRVRSI
jgi:beta-ribofuranosylaminobenzene 5'-phosphate synthase